MTFTGGIVYPIIHKKEMMEISLKTIEISRMGKDGLICQDNIRADIKVTFFLHVNKTAEDVLKVAQSVGCVRASHQETLETLFEAKFSEALKTVGKSMDFVELYQARGRFTTISSARSATTCPATCSKTRPSITSSRPRSTTWTCTIFSTPRASRRSPS
ncbi:hypothetical protein LP419_38395 [Massilia sp. H-1]|nr:hypothetical protein LP419_38395 [Massilia sp. H-1]